MRRTAGAAVDVVGTADGVDEPKRTVGAAVAEDDGERQRGWRDRGGYDSGAGARPNAVAATAGYDGDDGDVGKDLRVAAVAAKVGGAAAAGAAADADGATEAVVVNHLRSVAADVGRVTAAKVVVVVVAAELL